MRYMQMIKRCKKLDLPLKKATHDVEAHSEESAKRCKLSTGELRVSSPSWEERLGHLHTSAVARLLVEGKLPTDTVCSGTVGDGGSPSAMDLSKSSTSVLDKARNFHKEEYRFKTESLDFLDATADKLRHQMQVEMEALKTRSSSNEVRFSGWKCRYCPYSCNTPKKLYSHYQFHQQLLTSHSSKPHMEWLAAYRQAKEDGTPSPTASTTVTSSTNTTTVGDSTISKPPALFPGNCLPVGLDDKDKLQAMRANGLSLRYLLGGKGHLTKQPGTSAEQNSASGCLRSIVQAVMQQGSSSKTSVTATSVYASLVNGSVNSGSIDGQGSAPSNIILTEVESKSITRETVLPKEEALADSRSSAQTVAIVKPKAIRPEVPVDMQSIPSRHGSPYMTDSPVGVSIQEDTRGYPHSVQDGPLHPIMDQTDLSQDSPLRRTVTVECQQPLSTPPPRPTSRGSVSSFTSTTSSEEINVDDSPPSLYDRRRIDSINSDYSDSPFVRSASRKRTRSMELDNTSQGAFQQNHYTSFLCNDPSCRPVEDLGRVPSAKVPCLDYTYSNNHSHMVKDELRNPKEMAKSRHSPTAVISSTGTPPPLPHNMSCLKEDDLTDEANMPIDVTSLDTKDMSIQCELLVPPTGQSWKQLGPEAAIPDQSSNQDGDYYHRANASPALIGSMKCPHCGITFDDSVLHSIHMGCHSHCDPFICNVCGEQCGNKYGFYTHIMRGHHKRT